MFSLLLLLLLLPQLLKVFQVFSDVGEPFAAILTEVPQPKAGLPAEMAVLEVALATVEPVIAICLAFNLWEK